MGSEPLVTWLRVQLDEDERVANSATSGPWTNADPMASDGVFAAAVDGFVADCLYERMGPFAIHNATHVARHDPTRVLAEVEAKRRILDEHDTAGWKVGDRVHDCQWADGTWPCATVRLLALPYADRDGWREEWRVQ
jgi:uncharacterized protein DUF6221